MDVLEMFEWASYAAEALLGAVFALLCYRQAGKREDTQLFFLLLAGFFSCICMSDFFFVLTWIIEDYPFTFSSGDLSWVGSFLFLITAVLNVMDGWTPGQKEAARRYRLPALIAPAVCVALNAFFIYSLPDITVNYLLYAVPTVILLYLSLWLFLAGKNAGIQPGLRRYHLTVFIWLALQMICDLFTTFKDIRICWVAGTIFWYIVLLVMPGIYFSARRRADPMGVTR